MKLILAIVSREDANTVAKHLSESGFYATKLATTGGFMKIGNTTFLIGLEDEKVQPALSIIEKYAHRRADQAIHTDYLSNTQYHQPVSVAAGGATVFVIDVEQFFKV
jgi:uncharacterized protein YaaQ